MRFWFLFYSYHNLQGSQTKTFANARGMSFTLIIIYKVLKLLDYIKGYTTRFTLIIIYKVLKLFDIVTLISASFTLIIIYKVLKHL